MERITDDALSRRPASSRPATQPTWRSSRSCRTASRSGLLLVVRLRRRAAARRLPGLAARGEYLLRAILIPFLILSLAAVGPEHPRRLLRPDLARHRRLHGGRRLRRLQVRHRRAHSARDFHDRHPAAAGVLRRSCSAALMAASSASCSACRACASRASISRWRRWPRSSSSTGCSSA